MSSAAIIRLCATALETEAQEIYDRISRAGRLPAHSIDRRLYERVAKLRNLAAQLFAIIGEEGR